MEKSKIQEIEEKLVEVERAYSIDRMELARLLAIVSAMLLVISVYGFYVVDSALSEIRTVESSMERTVGITQSESFNRSMQALRDLGGTGAGNEINTALEGLQSSRQDLLRVERAVDRLERQRTYFQWMSLLGIVGMVAGASIFFI